MLEDLCSISAGDKAAGRLVCWLVDQEPALNLSAFRGILNRWNQSFGECRMVLISMVAVSVGTALVRFPGVYFAREVLVPFFCPVSSCVSVNPFPVCWLLWEC